MKDNLILQSDAYKYTHWLQYPEGTRHVYSYLESRGSEIDGVDYNIFFGLQYYLLRYLEGIRVTQQDIEEAERILTPVFGHNRYFNREGWERIVNVHGGRIPVEIRAVKEGTKVPNGNVLMTIVNTDPEIPWITNFIETLLLKVWYPTTVATISHSVYNSIQNWTNMTGGEVSPFHLNDFGYRGVSSEESAGIGGMSHLVNFKGTDTIAGIVYAEQYYGIDDGDSYGHSVMASEHSTTTIYGRDSEHEVFAKFMKASGPGSIVSLVSDSYDYFEAVEAFCTTLKKNVLDHAESGGRTVIRPDSGDPVEVTIRTLQILEKHYNIETNDKGYKLLPPCIGIIYGDGLNYQMIYDICKEMEDHGWAIDGRNVIFGMGGGLLQQCNRDTFKFAIKCSAAKLSEGEWIDVYKDPATMTSKKSNRGRLSLMGTAEGYETVSYDPDNNWDLLEPVFRDGKILRYQSLTNVREMCRK